jgi:hypothetical protein
MNFFIHDPNELQLPPEEVRLREVKVTTQANGSRVKIYIELTPFIERPNVDVTITGTSGKEVAHTSVLETMLSKLELTMHLRQPEQGSEYAIETTVYYQRMPLPSDIPMDIHLSDPMIVDRHKATFVFPQLVPES